MTANLKNSGVATGLKKVTFHSNPKERQYQIFRWYLSNSRNRKGTKEPLDESERGAWKADLKLNIQKTKITACDTIMSWQTEGEKVETVTDFIFLHFKITVDSDCSHEIKRCLLLGRKAMTILGSVLKSRDITFLTKVHACHVILVVSKFLWPYEL